MSNNPPAFPTKHSVLDPRSTGFQTEEGMTLLDYFAAKALHGLLSSPMERFRGSADQRGTAKICYDFAEAMIAERQKRTPQP